MHDVTFQFRNAILAVGLELPNFIEPGRMYRFPGIDKHTGNTAGWCKLFDDGLGGCFGDWSSGLSEYWQSERTQRFHLILIKLFLPLSRIQHCVLLIDWD